MNIQLSLKYFSLQNNCQKVTDSNLPLHSVFMHIYNLVWVCCTNSVAIKFLGSLVSVIVASTHFLTHETVTRSGVASTKKTLFVMQAVRAARSVCGFSSKIEVECRSAEEGREAAGAGADIVMLDNFQPQVKNIKTTEAMVTSHFATQLQ